MCKVICSVIVLIQKKSSPTHLVFCCNKILCQIILPLHVINQGLFGMLVGAPDSSCCGYSSCMRTLFQSTTLDCYVFSSVKQSSCLSFMMLYTMLWSSYDVTSCYLLPDNFDTNYEEEQVVFSQPYMYDLIFFLCKC